MNSGPIAVRVLDPGFWVFIVICMIIIMLVLALYISVFKRMKMNFQVKGELERVLKENDLATQQFWKDEAVVQERRLQLKEKEFSADYDDDEILTIESATGLLKSLGWSVEIEGKGDYLATLFLPDREVQFLYNEKRVEEFSPFDRGLLIMSGIFAAACQTINPHNSGVVPTVFMNFVPNGLEIFEEKVSAHLLKKALDKTLKWTMEDDSLHEMFRSQYSIPPWEKDSSSWAPDDEVKFAPYALLHLAALALLGDVETLASYDESFTAGEKLGFDETIEKVHLERAMVIAQEVKGAGKFSYDLLERVAEKWSIAMDYQRFRVRSPNTCNQKRDFHKKLVEEKKQELREQGFDVSDKQFVFEAEGVKHAPDITYIKDGEPAFMDIKID
ncbi:DUF6990 domain-containing protein [Bartonella grahamii]|uniref:Uncharacterized protein n=2 Tax=Bartonella grahamii TaxID=33045 RepID=A0A336NKQ7_BARGR|nr:hypothetical protein [Bartonella grahamii]ACS51867.1 hypothetical protein Bgr_17510 [Bartonella grahamii as4aup]SSZ39432.1 Uncharacterised protein [Bartonella grahamii]